MGAWTPEDAAGTAATTEEGMSGAPCSDRRVAGMGAWTPEDAADTAATTEEGMSGAPCSDRRVAGSGVEDAAGTHSTSSGQAAATTEDEGRVKHPVVTGVSPVWAREDAADTAATTADGTSGHAGRVSWR